MDELIKEIEEYLRKPRESKQESWQNKVKKAQERFVRGLERK